MTDSEMRELDAWIAGHVMGWTPRIRKADSIYPELRYWNKGDGYEILQQQFRPTTDPAAAMLVLKRCLDETELGIISHSDGYGIIANRDVVAPTLELAICKFAKAIYSK